MTENTNGQVDMWAVVELMGHGRTAGIIRTSDLGGLLRVDVPVDDGFRTEYYGNAAVYSIKVVSEEIARAYALPDRDIMAYDEPIVPRAEYERALRAARSNNRQLEARLSEMQRRLVAVNGLPAGAVDPEAGTDPFDHYDDEEDAPF